jgi:hypothetical protein
VEEIWIAMLFFCIGWHFYHQRKLAESARRYIAKYCEENTLQFMSIAKLKARIVIDKKRGIQWENHYHFEFSGDGESSYEGTLTLRGTKVKDIDMPVYRVN